ncbi:MAG: 23S rRNA (uracil(1939)-C(5))-methyltransferase RlmD [Chloroflexota bacterium]|nr:23S rRNA (uracil(1939)-C(5))-methyltransferase RlmD [Chloroflexota bacterium]
MSDLFEVTPFAMGHGGDAIGRHAGKAIFIPYAIPGERIRAEIVAEHKHYARARLMEVLAPSPVRVEPACPHFSAHGCGGCQFQHIAYPAQVQLKGLIVRDQLQRIGKFEDPTVLEPLPDENGWEYRNHALFHTTPDGQLGFLSAGSHEVIRVTECPVLHPLLSELYRSLDVVQPNIEQLELRVGTATGDLMVLLQTYDEEPPALQVDFPLSIVQVRHDTTPTALVGLDYINEIIKGREFRISATSFYQANSPQAAKLVDLVLEALELQPDEQVVDAYCGVGLFTAFLAEKASLVTGIELNRDAVADALYNLADAENVTLLEGPVAQALKMVEQTVDAVVVDPPRTGLDTEAVDALVALAPTRIAYVSCDPATLARDARRLANQGYELAWVQPVDLFPQTFHIESVALLFKKS